MEQKDIIVIHLRDDTIVDIEEEIHAVGREGNLCTFYNTYNGRTPICCFPIEVIKYWEWVKVKKSCETCTYRMVDCYPIIGHCDEDHDKWEAM